jgi:hypothetical protein
MATPSSSSRRARSARVTPFAEPRRFRQFGARRSLCETCIERPPPPPGGGFLSAIRRVRGRDIRRPALPIRPRRRVQQTAQCDPLPSAIGLRVRVVLADGWRASCVGRSGSRWSSWYLALGSWCGVGIPPAAGTDPPRAPLAAQHRPAVAPAACLPPHSRFDTARGARSARGSVRPHLLTLRQQQTERLSIGHRHW